MKRLKLKNFKPSQWRLRLNLLRARRLRRTYNSRWGRFWFRHPGAKRVSLFSATLVVVVVGLLAARLFFAANRIIVSDKSAAALMDDVDPSLLNKEGDGRINLLLIGVGGAEHVAGDLSDSIMIVSLDPIAKELAMINIPRDLYVAIDGFGSAKINAAHAYGEQFGYPGGGPKLLTNTITTTLGISLPYYTRVDFKGFEQAIDVVGGVDVDVKKAINDSSYPAPGLNGYEPFYLKAGPRHLDSKVALKFARSRYGSSDFERASRQQQLLLALKDKAFSLGTILDPIKLNRLLSIASGHIRTNLSIDDGLKFANLLREVNNNSVKHTNLSDTKTPLLTSRVINDSWVLSPVDGSFEAIKRYLRRLMPDGFIKREASKIKILNASAQPGLARATASLLKSYGYQVVEVGNSQRQEQKTTIIDYSNGSHRYTLNYLKKRFKTNPQAAVRPQNQTEDITIILGADYQLTSD